MNVEFVARNYHLDDQIRSFAENKLAKVTKFVEEPIEVRLTLELEKHRNIADLHVAHRFGVLQAREETADMYDAVNMVVDKAEKQARRSRKKFVDRRRRAGRQNGQGWPIEVLERDSLGAGAAPRIIETSILRIKPMTIEEAALELERSDDEFVIFRDSTSERVNVLYKRKDQNYGLIAPEL